MQELQDRIKAEGKNLGGGILKVDGLINHQVDPELMDHCGKELATAGCLCQKNPSHHHAAHCLLNRCPLPHQG